MESKKDSLDVLNEKLNAFNEKLEVFSEKLDDFATDEENFNYDKYYRDFLNELACKTTEELQKEKFMAENIILKRKRQNNASIYSLMISVLALMFSMFNNSFFWEKLSLYFDENIQIIIWAAISILFLLFVVFYACMQAYYQLKFQKDFPKLKLKIKVIDILIKNRQ